MRRIAPILLVTLLLAACSASVQKTNEVADTRESLDDYIDSVDHLSVDQQKAMRDGKPFVGMTLEEANKSMSYVKSRASLNGDVLEAEFQNQHGLTYVLFFDCGTPNRVSDWSMFKREDVEQIKQFRDVHPCPPIPSRSH